VDKRWATVIVVLPWVILSKAICTNTSDSGSNDEVASSNNNNFGRRIIALAIAILCSCPPLSLLALLFPMIVSYPSGNELIKSWILAIFEASMISLLVALGLP